MRLSVRQLIAWSLLLARHLGSGFLIAHRKQLIIRNNNSITRQAVGERFSIPLELPPSTSNQAVQVTFPSILAVPSEAIVVRYRVPFQIAVAPARGFVLCTQDGPGGEREGDILRYTSRFAIGLPRGESIANTVGSFVGGSIKWQCYMYDVMTARTWKEVMEALISNTQTRTDEAVLIFERPLETTVVLDANS